MKKLFLNITISPDLYLKNPESSELGKKIISKSIVLIDELGFEDLSDLEKLLNIPKELNSNPNVSFYNLDKIIVIGVFHTSRSPIDWSKRLK